ncbi:alpha/beta hydrolase-fold protein [soil metagenome]
MAVARVRFKSEAFGRWMTYNILLPDNGEGPFPVVMQLHGLGDDHRSWIDRTNIVRYAGEYPLVIVFPDGGTSGYLNWNESGRLHRQAYEDLIVKDIPDHLRRHFNVTHGPWAIGGLSMGGYGAMRIGLKYPERFSSIWAHSAAFHIDQYLDPDLIAPEAIEDAGVEVHARRLVESGAPRPVISCDCGVDDELLQFNRELDSLMNQIDLTHHYAEHPGAHTWDYWDEHVQTALAQHHRVLNGNGL